MSRPITALVPWYGSNRTLAANVGAALKGCRWVGVPFAGGMCELRHIEASTILVGDLHRHVINLANVLKSGEFGPMLIRDLRRQVFHEDELANAQRRLTIREKRASEYNRSVMSEVSYEDAVDYFVIAWMGRNGTAGTPAEFKAGLSVRWDAGGGDSAIRFRSAVEALRDWRTIMVRCTFVVRDVFDFLREVQDKPGHGLYCDPPFPGPGDKYTHPFDERKQRRLSEELTSFKTCRVVCRFYDHPLIRELYSEGEWQWHHFKGRTQANGVGAEVLLVRNGHPTCQPPPPTPRNESEWEQPVTMG